MREIFTQRAARIAKAQLGDWQAHSRENEDASWAAEEVRSSTWRGQQGAAGKRGVRVLFHTGRTWSALPEHER